MHKKFAVLGSPIKHSLSPLIHKNAFAVQKLDWHYESFEISEADFIDFISTAEHSGFSVTMPLKTQAASIADTKTPIVAATGIANTLLRLPAKQKNDSCKEDAASNWCENKDYIWHAANTDVPGLAMVFKEKTLNPEFTVILGAGSTAVSAGIAAVLCGAKKIVFCARKDQAAGAAAKLLKVTMTSLGYIDFSVAACTFINAAALLEADGQRQSLTVSALPGAAEVLLPESLIAGDLFDVAYDPWPTTVAKQWISQNLQVVSGLEMLVSQGLLQQRLFINGDARIQLSNEQAVFKAMRQALGLS